MLRRDIQQGRGSGVAFLNRGVREALRMSHIGNLGGRVFYNREPQEQSPELEPGSQCGRA